jgi:hypothetical protein
MSFDLANTNDRFGFFQSGQFRSYSKFACQEHSIQTGNSVEWNFNDEFFSTIDWTQEPTESIKELYAERVRQLREKYDYLVLYLSGGSDSHNILSTFYENDVYLDEILTYHTLKAEKDKLAHQANMIEITLAAIPQAEEYKKKFPTTTHRLVDISDIIVDNWTKNLDDLKFNFIYYRNYYLGSFQCAAGELPDLLPAYQRLIDSGKRICFIHGTDKPNINFKDKKWAFRFRSDRIDSGGFSIRRQMQSAPVDDVFFYWDPDAWRILVKQCHSIRRYFYDHPHLIRKAWKEGWPEVPDSHKAFFYLELPQQNWTHLGSNNVPDSIIKHIIYPHWRPDIVNIGKPPTSLYGWKNQWWHRSNHLPGVKEHIAGIKHVAKTIGADLLQPKQIVYFSKPYYF